MNGTLDRIKASLKDSKQPSEKPEKSEKEPEKEKEREAYLWANLLLYNYKYELHQGPLTSKLWDILPQNLMDVAQPSTCFPFFLHCHSFVPGLGQPWLFFSDPLGGLVAPLTDAIAVPFFFYIRASF